jgi:hypothetical protein
MRSRDYPAFCRARRTMVLADGPGWATQAWHDAYLARSERGPYHVAEIHDGYGNPGELRQFTGYSDSPEYWGAEGSEDEAARVYYTRGDQPSEADLRGAEVVWLRQGLPDARTLELAERVWSHPERDVFVLAKGEPYH